MSQEPFGRLVRRYRREAELTQEALAERAGLSVRAIRDIEAGTKHRPRRDTVELLLDALTVPAAQQAAFREAALPEQVDVGDRLPERKPEHRALPVGRFLGSLPQSTLIARGEELERILHLVDEAASPEGRLILLSGEPGVGKTRLAQEVTVELQNRGAIIGTGRCYEPEQSVPYFAILDALSTLLQASPSALRAEIPDHWPYLSKLFPDEVRLSAPLDSGGHDEELLLFRAVTGFLAALSQSAPVALLLDDLHWADSATLKMLLYLARHTRSDAVFLLGTYRDVEVGRQHPLEGALRDLDREGVVERVQIRRLSERDTGSLIAELMREPEVSEEFAALVHGRTEGNPFFVQQVLRVLVERGDVFQRNGRWDRKSVAEIEVPESIRSVIGQRLSRLPDTVQDLLRVASVFGQGFQFDDLLGVTQLEDGDQEESLDVAAKAGLIQTTNGDDYAFDHALTQQTLYAELPARRRRRLHAAAAAAIEKSAKARDAELAWHYLQADEAERALPCALRAGDGATGVYAWSEAEMQYRTALQLAQELGDGGREAAAWRKLGDLLFIVGRNTEAIECLQQAGEAYLAVDDFHNGTLAAIEVANTLYFGGGMANGVDVLEHLLHAHPDDGSSPSLALAAAARDFLDAWTRHAFGEVLSAVERAYEYAMEAGDARLIALYSGIRGTGLRVNGRWAEAFPFLEGGVRLPEGTRNPLIQLYCSNFLAEAYLFSARWADGRDVMRYDLILAERIHNLPLIAYARAHIGEALTPLGDWDGARTELETAVAFARSIERGWTSALPYCRHIELCIKDGSWDEAEALLDELTPIAQAIDDRQWVQLAEIY